MPGTVPRMSGGEGMWTPFMPPQSRQQPALTLRDTEKARGQGPQTSPNRGEGSKAEGKGSVQQSPLSPPGGFPRREFISKGLPGAEVIRGPTF